MKSKSPWRRSQYLDPLITEVMFDWRTHTQAEVDQILEQMKLPAGAGILDLACGQGRHAIELAKRGFQVMGLDYSPLLIRHAEAMSKKHPRSKRPQFIEGDMRRLKSIFQPESFDAVVNQPYSKASWHQTFVAKKLR